MDDSSDFKNAILGQFFGGRQSCELPDQRVCVLLVCVNRAGIPELLTRAFFLGLGFGPSKCFALERSKFQHLWICRLLNIFQ